MVRYIQFDKNKLFRIVAGDRTLIKVMLETLKDSGKFDVIEDTAIITLKFKEVETDGGKGESTGNDNEKDRQK